MPHRTGKSKPWTSRISLAHQPVCPICGRLLSPNAWATYKGFAICAGKRHDLHPDLDRIIEFLLDNTNSFFWVGNSSIIWYTPYNIFDDELQHIRDAIQLYGPDWRTHITD